MRHSLTLAAAFLLLGASAPALGLQPELEPGQTPADQPATEPSSPIVVTGDRPSPGLVIDLARVARECSACRRALRRLRTASRTRRPMAIDSDHPVGSTAIVPHPMASQNAGSEMDIGTDDWGAVMSIHRRAQRDEQALRLRTRNRVADRGEADRFTSNLLRFVEPIVERIRRERGAEAVLAVGDPEARGRGYPDITAAVVEALDREHGAADLLADPAA